MALLQIRMKAVGMARPLLRAHARSISSTHQLLLPHLQGQRKEDSPQPQSPFLLPSAGLHTTPPLEHGYVNPKFPTRPISPHVTIYAFPVVAFSSITMRVSGVLLTIGCAGIGGMACMDPAAPVELMSSLGSSPLYAIPAKIAVSFPLVYHFAGALRHTYWDQTAGGLKNATVEQSSYVVVGASLALTAAISAM